MMFIRKLLDLGHGHGAPIPIVLTNIVCLTYGITYLNGH